MADDQVPPAVKPVFRIAVPTSLPTDDRDAAVVAFINDRPMPPDVKVQLYMTAAAFRAVFAVSAAMSEEQQADVLYVEIATDAQRHLTIGTFEVLPAPPSGKVS